MACQDAPYPKPRACEPGTLQRLPLAKIRVRIPAHPTGGSLPYDPLPHWTATILPNEYCESEPAPLVPGHRRPPLVHDPLHTKMKATFDAVPLSLRPLTEEFQKYESAEIRLPPLLMDLYTPGRCWWFLNQFQFSLHSFPNVEFQFPALPIARNTPQFQHTSFRNHTFQGDPDHARLHLLISMFHPDFNGAQLFQFVAH